MGNFFKTSKIVKTWGKFKKIPFKNVIKSVHSLSSNNAHNSTMSMIIHYLCKIQTFCIPSVLPVS